MKLKLAYPLAPLHVNQGWGVNGAYYQANGINIKGHNGLDLQAYHGQPVYASHDGVAFYEVDSSGGNGVVIITNQPYDYGQGQAYFKSIYWHLCDHEKEPKYTSQVYTLQQQGSGSSIGVPVKQGQQIGWADSTGLSSGDHLHFGLKPVNPGVHPTFGDSPDMVGDYISVEPNNGYLGAIDPTPYLDASQNQGIILSTLTALIGLYKTLLGLK